MCKHVTKCILNLTIFFIFFSSNFSCRKLDTSTEKNIENKFNVHEAKEYWYGVFKKSTEYTLIDESATNVKMIKKMANLNNIQFSNNRMPIWSKGISYTVGKFECVEFPLLYGHKVTIIDGEKNLSTEQKYKLVDTKLEKVVLIKEPNGKIEVRIVSILPKYDYALQMNFDISNNHTNYLDPNFKGIIQVRKWSETIIRTNEIANNKVVKKIKDKLSKSNYTNTTSRSESDATCPESQNCPNGGHWESFFTHVCENNNYTSGDVSVVVACLHTSGDNTYVCQYWVCNSEEGDGEDDDDDTPVDCSANVLPYEECMCTYYGLQYCPDGDGDDGDDATNDPCDKVKNLATDNAYKQSMQNLKDNLNSNKEYSFLKDNNGLVLNIPPGLPNAGEIHTNLPDNIAAYTHSHSTANGNDLLPIFAIGDLLALHNIISSGKANANNFTFSLISNTGNWSLTIDDLTKFNDFFNTFFNNEENENVLNDKYNEYGIHKNTSSNLVEERFLKLLKDTNSGLGLLRGSNDFGNYTKLNLNNSNSIVPSPCN